MSDSDPLPLKAAIDIGTNSIHLVVARVGEYGGFDLLTREKESVRLGQGGGEMKQLAADAIDRGIDALSRLVQLASSFGPVELVAVATSAVREADNRDQFLHRARTEVGIEIEVISGFEEARLIHLGVLQALPVFDTRLLVVDIGGGSTELCIGDRGKPVEVRSMKLGAIRLTERFFADVAAGVVPHPDAVTACRQYVRAALAPVAHELGGHQPELAVASSGTATTIATMALAARGEEAKSLTGVTFTAAELDAVVAEIVSRPATKRRKLAGLDDKRVDIILGGALLLQEVFAAFALTSMTISEYALREGVLFDRFGGDAGHELADLRHSNVRRLAQQLDPDPAHGEHTSTLACQLFDRTNRLHGLDAHARELLDAAAVLHNVGLFISHASHHKHSYYVIRNSELLMGFTDREIELIALIARYHRKSRPSTKHPEFAALAEADQQLVRILAGLLRLAIGLDRRHAGVVHSVRVLHDEGHIRVEPVGDGDLGLELYAAADRAEMLGDALGVDVEVAAAPVFDHAEMSR